MDKTYIHHFTLESNWQSVKRHAANESCLKCPHMQQSASKVMVSVFWDVHRIIYIDYLEKGTSTNSNYYIKLLVYLKNKITKKKTTHKEEKNHHSPGRYTVPQFNENNGQIEQVAL